MGNDASPIYYRLYWPASAPTPAVVTMQWIDEPDYDADRFVTAEKYDTPTAAMEHLLRIYGAARG